MQPVLNVSCRAIDEKKQWLVAPRFTDPAEVKPLLMQFPGEQMQSWAVGKKVGNVRNQGPQLMAPIDAPQVLEF